MEFLNSLGGLEGILTALGVLGGGGAAYAGRGILKNVIVIARNLPRIVRGLQQAVDTFEEWKTLNKTIYKKTLEDPKKQDLAFILNGGIEAIEGLTGLDL